MAAHAGGEAGSDGPGTMERRSGVRGRARETGRKFDTCLSLDEARLDMPLSTKTHYHQTRTPYLAEGFALPVASSAVLPVDRDSPALHSEILSSFPSPGPAAALSSLCAAFAFSRGVAAPLSDVVVVVAVVVDDVDAVFVGDDKAGGKSRAVGAAEGDVGMLVFGKAACTCRFRVSGDSVVEVTCAKECNAKRNDKA